MFKNNPLLRLGDRSPTAPAAPQTGGGGRGGRGGGAGPAGVSNINMQPMAASPRLTTLDGPPPGPSGTGVGPVVGLGGGRGGGGGGGGRGGGGDATPAAASAARGPGSLRRDVKRRAARAALVSDRPDDLLLSGALAGGENLVGRPVLLDAPVGTGHVDHLRHAAFWRFQTQGNFFLAFNAMLNWNNLAVK